jgi:hypothetical protein
MFFSSFLLFQKLEKSLFKIKLSTELCIYQILFASSFSIIKQLMPALAVNIIIVHPWDVAFPWAKVLGKTTPLG